MKKKIEEGTDTEESPEHAPRKGNTEQTPEAKGDRNRRREETVTVAEREGNKQTNTEGRGQEKE
jgi:hypothetical protein